MRETLLHVLSKGLLRIRAEGFSGRANQCAIDADHLHNLPSLVLQPSLQPLSYYLDVTRIAFIKSVRDTSEFEVDWKRLEAVLSDMLRSPE
jgi:hypothetical protein